MKIVKPYAKLIPPWSLDGYGPENTFPEVIETSRSGELGLKFIEWCGRISHRSEDKMTDFSYERILKDIVIKHGDWSIVEHVSVSVDALVDRGITHEWVRHRLFSYTQESTRFVNYEKKMPPSFIYPIPEVECGYCLSGMEVKYRLDCKEWMHYRSEDNLRVNCSYNSQWLFAIQSCEDQYRTLLANPKENAVGAGWRPQEARSVFPNALASRIIVTGNLRNWRHFFIMRTTQEAHPQMRQVAIPLLKEFQQTFPILFDDITPETKQSVSMARVR